MEHAASLARALQRANAADQARVWIDSARRAYDFAASSFDAHARVSVAMKLGEVNVTWTEAPQVNGGQQAQALAQLWLATGDTAFFDALNTPQMTQAFRGEVDSLYWRTTGFEFVDAVLNADKFPGGWADYARTGIVNQALDWLRWMEADAYRHVWYAPGEGYFSLMGWGIHGFRHIPDLIAAWRVTGESRFRAAALLAVDWMHGANPQGRVWTTGLGKNFVVHPLHLPADSDGIADPVPGITIYGSNLGLPFDARSVVYGLFLDAQPNLGFAGASLAQLPPPWNDTSPSLNAIADILYSNIPVWRRITNLEAANPPQMEFTVEETISPAMAVTGCLLGPGWMPSEQLRHRQPRTEAELRDSLWYQP